MENSGICLSCMLQEAFIRRVIWRSKAVEELMANERQKNELAVTRRSGGQANHQAPQSARGQVGRLFVCPSLLTTQATQTFAEISRNMRDISRGGQLGGDTLGYTCLTCFGDCAVLVPIKSLGTTGTAAILR